MDEPLECITVERKKKIKIIITKKKNIIKLKKYNQYLRMYMVDINQKCTPT